MNYKIMLKPFTRLLLLSALASVFTGQVMAKEDDFNQPIKIDSRTQFGDGKNKLSIFRGDVKVTQGSLLIEADDLEIDASQGEGQEVFIARGKPASYSQEFEDGERVVASANEIRYQVSLRTIRLVGDASLVKDSSSVSGDAIMYDMAREQILAEGSEGSDGRVTTVFTPESLKKANEDKQEQQQEDPPQ